MATKKLKAVTRVVEGLRVECDVRGFKVIMDEPKEMGGTNLGMNPMELILCGLGGCQAITAAEYAGMFGVDLKDFWIEVEGDLERPRLKDVRIGYLEVRYRMHVKTSANEDKVNKLIEFIEKSCPVGDTLMGPVKLVYAGVAIER